jgi:hypothetical protein
VVRLPECQWRADIAIWGSKQTRSYMGLVHLVQETKQVQLHHLGQGMASLGQACGPSQLQAAYETRP